MLIRKTQKERLTAPTPQQRLVEYRTQATGFLRAHKSVSTAARQRFYSGLQQVLPFAAVALTPFAMQAQSCDPAGGGVVDTNPPCGGNNGITLDIDGGGIDLVFLYSGGGLQMKSVNGINFARTVNGSYAYLIGYADGATINSASGNFGGLRSQASTICFPTSQYGWLDYESYSTGGWHGLTGGTRVLGFIKDSKLGFVEISYNDGVSNINSMSIGEYGTAAATTATTSTITAGTCSSLLPVEFASFTGQKKDAAFALNWQTATEENNEGFELERSTDGKAFHKIAWIPGVGNSNDLQSYNYLDQDLRANQTYYYRLKQMDFDGAFAYSSIIEFTNAVAGTVVVKDFAPNPVTTDFADLHILSPERQGASVAVFDAHGKAVFEKQTTLIVGQHTVRLPLRGVASGTYFVRLILADGTSHFKKLVVAD